ncbi:MAG: hypothetical protein O7A04_06140 [Acidobacteria bacterium]|nr:hypothetical protein [Acidobacteriota bacterium]
MPARSVEARAPCRVDLGGGTLDIWPIGLLHPGACTVNVAIDLMVEVTLTRRDRGYSVEQSGDAVEVSSLEELMTDPATALAGLVADHFGLPPTDFRLRSDSPRGAGLGASSALAVALIAAVGKSTGEPRLEPSAVAHLARDLEARLMALPTGTQDYYPSLLGGALEIRHLPGGETAVALSIDLDLLGRHLTLAFTGQSHVSGETNWGIVRRRLDGDQQSLELFAAIAETAGEMVQALKRGDLERVGGLMSREWSSRRQLSDGASTDRIESLLEVSRLAGAWGGKACGAGGGGCVAVLAPEEARESLRDELAAAGAEVLETSPTATCLEVIG